MSEDSTTPDLVELSRRLSEAANRRDFDAVMSFWSPDSVWEALPGLGTYEGLAAIRGFFEDWLSAYEEFEIEPEEVLELGNGVMLSVLPQNARLAGSSGRVRLRYAAVSVWVEGMIVLTTNYLDIDEARAAAERLAEDRG
jgi:ketosteroid isomerase-like protein